MLAFIWAGGSWVLFLGTGRKLIFSGMSDPDSDSKWSPLFSKMWPQDFSNRVHKNSKLFPEILKNGSQFSGSRFEKKWEHNFEGKTKYILSILELKFMKTAIFEKSCFQIFDSMVNILDANRNQFGVPGSAYQEARRLANNPARQWALAHYQI